MKTCSDDTLRDLRGMVPRRGEDRRLAAQSGEVKSIATPVARARDPTRCLHTMPPLAMAGHRTTRWRGARCAWVESRASWSIHFRTADL